MYDVSTDICEIYGAVVAQWTRSSADADKPDDTIRDQSRSPNIVPFHTLGILSSCTIVTLSLRRAFSDIRLHKMS